MKSYEELIKMEEFEDRFRYLKLGGRFIDNRFDEYRYLNQNLYHSAEWKRIRRLVIIRDNGCDLGHRNHIILPGERIEVHHINPLTIEIITNHDPIMFDLNNLITVSPYTHNAIHYGHEHLKSLVEPIERKPNDTIPWK